MPNLRHRWPVECGDRPGGSGQCAQGASNRRDTQRTGRDESQQGAG